MIAVVHPLWILWSACSLLCAATCGGLLVKALDEQVGVLTWVAAVAFVLWSALSVVVLVWEFL
jgi:hypothetical protein